MPRTCPTCRNRQGDDHGCNASPEAAEWSGSYVWFDKAGPARIDCEDPAPCPAWRPRWVYLDDSGPSERTVLEAVTEDHWLDYYAVEVCDGWNRFEEE